MKLLFNCNSIAICCNRYPARSGYQAPAEAQKRGKKGLSLQAGEKYQGRSCRRQQAAQGSGRGIDGGRPQRAAADTPQRSGYQAPAPAAAGTRNQSKTGRDPDGQRAFLFTGEKGRKPLRGLLFLLLFLVFFDIINARGNSSRNKRGKRNRRNKKGRQRQ